MMHRWNRFINHGSGNEQEDAMEAKPFTYHSEFRVTANGPRKDKTNIVRPLSETLHEAEAAFLNGSPTTHQFEVS
jgi:hypothetical protein